MTLPILWSFRRCPYAMRARLAISVSGMQVQLREIVLRSKPDAFLVTSPSATVPCLKFDKGVIDESFDIMLWALGQNDPEAWLDMADQGHSLIETSDGPFKTSLDRYKYASRHPDGDALVERAKAAEFLTNLNLMLDGQAWLFGGNPTLADMAILPFVRQFAHVDLDWFLQQPWPHLITWLNAFKSSPRFLGIMSKYTPWTEDDEPVIFPPTTTD